MAVNIRKIQLTELTDKFEGNYTFGCTFNEFRIEMDEGDDGIFYEIYARLPSFDINLSEWKNKHHVLLVTYSNYRLMDLEDIEEAEQYLNQEYGGLEVIDEGLDNMIKVHLI